MKNKFKECACEFKNEADAEEELDELGFDLNEAEREYFEEEEQ